MKLLKEITNENIGEKLKAIEFNRFRQAARTVILDSEGKVALLFVSKSNYHKLPGGGLEENETSEQALIREAKEEIGCEIEIIGELGRIIEYKVFDDTGAGRYESFGYLAKVVGAKGKHSFTSEENELGFQPVEWYKIEEAIEILESDKTEIYQGKFVLIRDLIFLKEAIKLMEKL